MWKRKRTCCLRDRRGQFGTQTVGTTSGGSEGQYQHKSCGPGVRWSIQKGGEEGVSKRERDTGRTGNNACT